ncbi:hypothetical protein [Thalassobacillus pellis]|nr:hypothetical protein [Thalassobacillus pellis]MBM7553273.1 metal-dependent amidase/aminoacylase/carboxypeptidase family protein [Thalassobacillus pellis]
MDGKNPAVNAIFPHHHPKFDIDEETILTIGKVFLLSLMNHQVIPENAAD